jgi:uncharacterized Zn finger protein (UPF0148 family)
MRELIRKFDKIFNCDKCNKTIWLKYHKYADRTILCPICFEVFENEKRKKILEERSEEDKERQRRLAIGEKKRELQRNYSEKKIQEIIDEGFGEIIFNFFEKKYNNNPVEEEIEKFWKLLLKKYRLEIDYKFFFKIIYKAYEIIKEEKS